MKQFVHFIFVLSTTLAMAGENAAPSSHLVFDDNFEGDIVINEVRVPKNGEAKYTYYEALGWRGNASGYAGIQAHPKAHNYIFSIWDHKSHKSPIKAVHRGPGTLTENFGGEGTGLKSWNFELGWDTDVWYTLVSRCWPAGDHTYYGYWVRSSKTTQWTHMVTMDVATKDAFFKGGTDAFIEDWLETGKNPRTANLRNGWKRKMNGDWHPFSEGRYSVNHWDLDKGKRSFNFKDNWNGGIGKDETGEFYFMIAGGKKTKATVENPSKHSIKRTEKKPAFDPIKLDAVNVKFLAGRRMRISWELDPETLPQFSCTVSILTNGKTIAQQTAQAHEREQILQLPDSFDQNKSSYRVAPCDIFDNKPKPSEATLQQPQ